MLDTSLKRANAYKEASEVLLSNAKRFVTEEDINIFMEEMNERMSFVGKAFDGGFNLTLLSNQTFLWGGEQKDFNYVLETQVNLLRQRINETIKLNDPDRKWRGSSEIFPRRVLFTYTLDKE